MSKVSDNNEEQFRMLLMVIEDVRSGICLFQSEEQSKWAGRIQREQDGRKLIVHNIADDDDAGMPAISDFRNWLYIICRCLVFGSETLRLLKG